MRTRGIHTDTDSDTNCIVYLYIICLLRKNSCKEKKIRKKNKEELKQKETE